MRDPNAIIDMVGPAGHQSIPAAKVRALQSEGYGFRNEGERIKYDAAVSDDPPIETVMPARTAAVPAGDPPDNNYDDDDDDEG